MVEYLNKKMAKKQEPKVMESLLTGEFYYVTKYKDLGNGKLIARSKRKLNKGELKQIC